MFATGQIAMLSVSGIGVKRYNSAPQEMWSFLADCQANGAKHRVMSTQLSESTSAESVPHESGETVSSAPPSPAVKPQPKEIGGRNGLEPTRYGDWEKNGRCVDF